MNEENSKHQQAQLRSQTYQLFAGLLHQAMSKPQWSALVVWAKQIDGCSFLADIQQWILDNALLDTTGIQLLASDFTRLYRGIGEGYGPPPPYEHLYRENAEPVSCQNAVIQCYNNNNLLPQDPYHNSSDHIVAQLHYMALLAAKVPQQGIGDITIHHETNSPQLSFLKQHLLTWVTPWLKIITDQHSQLAFYPKLTQALVCFLQQDAYYLSGR